MTQPEALRLATVLQTSGWQPTQQELLEAAAELRRLHEENEQLRQALTQPEQKPVLAGSLSVRYFRGDKAMTDTYFEYLGDLSEGDYTLYTAPPKREWVGLTQDDKNELFNNWWNKNQSFNKLIEDTEEKLMEKNNG